MKAILLSGFGGVETLVLGERPDPVAGPGEILVSVRATALNRADLLQRRGRYPPPPGASEILGLEMAGEVECAGPGVADFRAGDRVCAVLAGGGYAERVAVPAGLAMRVPPGLSMEAAAAIPEAFLTAYRALFHLGGMGPGKTVLVHAGGSGVGTAAVQLVREAGGAAYVTAGSAGKIGRCLALGARGGWNYREGPFAPRLAAETGGRGVDIVLDVVGGPYLAPNLASLAVDGRLIAIGVMGGGKAEGIDLLDLLIRRLGIIGTSLRTLPLPEKERLTREFASFALPRFADGRLVPVIDSVFDWRDVAGAHARMEANANTGKIVLRVTG